MAKWVQTGNSGVPTEPEMPGSVNLELMGFMEPMRVGDQPSTYRWVIRAGIGVSGSTWRILKGHFASEAEAIEGIRKLAQDLDPATITGGT